MSQVPYIAGNTNYEFEKIDIKNSFLMLEPLTGTVATTEPELEAQMVGRLYVRDNGTASATVHICTGLRASVSAADTWATIS